MSEHRITIRLDDATYAQLEVRGSQGQPLAAIVRQALLEYLARQPDAPQTPPELALTVAAMAARLEGLIVEVEDLRTRLDALAAIRQPPIATQRQPPAAVAASSTTPRRRGRPSSPLHHQILALLAAHPEGLNAAAIRVYLAVPRPIGDILAGMVRRGVIVVQGQGHGRHFTLPAAGGET